MAIKHLLLNSLEPAVHKLAQLVSFAVRIDPALLRHIRRKFLTDQDAGLEAESSVKAIQSDADVSELIKVSRKQVFVIGFWEDPATKLEIPVRILLDLVPPADHPTMGKWLADFKTARSGDPAAWARVVDDSGYDVQAALYSDIYTAATKEDRTDWVFAVQENVAPFHVVKPLMSITEEFLAWGRVSSQQLSASGGVLI